MVWSTKPSLSQSTTKLYVPVDSSGNLTWLAADDPELVLSVFQVLTKSVVPARAGPATPTTASPTTPAPISHPRTDPTPAIAASDATGVFENMTHPHFKEVPGSGHRVPTPPPSATAPGYARSPVPDPRRDKI